MIKTKFITAIYSDLFGTEFGGRPSRNMHYRWSLLSLLKMSNAHFICYTSSREIESLIDFFYKQHNISKNQLKIIEYNLENHYFLDLFKQYKDFESAKTDDRCVEIQYMKFIWFLLEDMSYDYYYWIDAGLSHSGLIPNKYLDHNVEYGRQYYESKLFNNYFLNKLIQQTGNSFTIIGKENKKNSWSKTVDPKHFFQYDSSYHIIGGLFGGKKDLWYTVVDLFKKYAIKVTKEDNKIYHEEDIITLMYRNHENLFNILKFDTWYHEDTVMAGIDNEYFKDKKPFYKILEELNYE